MAGIKDAEPALLPGGMRTKGARVFGTLKMCVTVSRVSVMDWSEASVQAQPGVSWFHLHDAQSG